MDGLGIHGHGGAKKKGWRRGQIAPHEERGSGVYVPYDEGEMAERTAKKAPVKPHGGRGRKLWVCGCLVPG